jgi:hypothetical protein
MTSRRPCPSAPGPLEVYARQFDGLFRSLAQRRGFRYYLQGLLLPRDRNKTLTGLAGAEPITEAQHREVQRLQWFLTESSWDDQQINDRRVRLLCEDPATAPGERGVLVVDDTGERKDGTATAHVARQYLGSVGKVDNGIVAVTSLWADERCYWPVHAVTYTPASRLPGRERDPLFRTKPQLAVELIQAAQQAGIGFRAVVADCFYGDNPGFADALMAAKVPFVLALRARKGTWAPADAAHTPVEAAGELGWHNPRSPGQWWRIQRRFSDGHTETWWTADAALGGWGPKQRLRLVVATTDPARLPGHSSWYLLTNLPRPATRRAQQANLAEVVRLYGSSRATSRSRASLAGPTSRSEATGRSAGTGRWSAAPSRSAGRLSSPGIPTNQHCLSCPTRRPPPRRPRGGPPRPGIRAEPAAKGSWPAALRAVRAWLIPWSVLQRCWRSWSPAPPPRQLQRLLDAVPGGRPLHRYLPP